MGEQGERAARALRKFGFGAALAIGTAAIYGSYATLVSAQTATAKPASAAAAQKDDKGLAAIAELVKLKDYEAARWHPLHFKPAIETATNEQCLACHKEILTKPIRAESPAGVKAANATAWYQTLDTYAGPQMSFHARHLTSPFSQQVMNLSCNFCHQGHDPREEAPGSSATTMNVGNVVLRKQVDPETTCLLCHGKFPAEYMDGVDPNWHEFKQALENPDAPNGCLTCHAETFRTVRHQVSYLKSQSIEAAAKASSDVCFGCHGGRSWYRISYPYPRHPWPGMPKKPPAWAKDRPTASDARYAIEPKKN